MTWESRSTAWSLAVGRWQKSRLESMSFRLGKRQRQRCGSVPSDERGQDGNRRKFGGIASSAPRNGCRAKACFVSPSAGIRQFSGRSHSTSPRPAIVESGKRVVNLGAGSGPFSRFSGPDRLERAVQGQPAPCSPRTGVGTQGLLTADSHLSRLKTSSRLSRTMCPRPPAVHLPQRNGPRSRRPVL